MKRPVQSYLRIVVITLCAHFTACQPEPSGGAQEETRSTQNATVTLEEGVLQVDGAAFDIRGICWNPVPKGQTHPEGLAFLTGGAAYDLEFIRRDLELIAGAGFNTLRTYEPVTDTAVLELIQSQGLKVIVPALNFHAITDDRIRTIVTQLKEHPTTLFWEIGNEWNYNLLYNSNGDYRETLARIQSTITLIRSIDSRLPISVNYGELPSPETEAALDADIWGLNIYRSDDFGNVFEKWRQLSDKPIYIGEYGADAIDNRKGDGLYAPDAQARATHKLTQQIIDQYASTGQGQVLGGAIFAFSDEWWKDGKGSPSVHDIGGIAPGGGPYPDLEFNEEWWGIVDIDRNPRPAYETLKKLYKRINQ